MLFINKKNGFRAYESRFGANILGGGIFLTIN